MARAQKIREVRHDPVVAAVDEEIVVERFDILVHRAEGFLDDGEVRLQLAGRHLFGVANAINFRQAIEKLDSFVHGSHGSVGGGAAAVSFKCAG